jgi:hypothetical protein
MQSEARTLDFVNRRQGGDIGRSVRSGSELNVSKSSPLHLTKRASTRRAATSLMGHMRTHASQRAVGLFDQFVGTARQREWKGDTKRVGGLEVDV